MIFKSDLAADILTMRYRALQRHHADFDYPFTLEEEYRTLCSDIDVYLNGGKSPGTSWPELCHRCVELAAEVERYGNPD